MDNMFNVINNTKYDFVVKGTITKNLHNYIVSHRETNPDDNYYNYMAMYLQQGELCYGNIDYPNVVSYHFDKENETITFDIVGKVYIILPTDRSKRNMKEIKALSEPNKHIKHNIVLEMLNNICKGEVKVSEYQLED